MKNNNIEKRACIYCRNYQLIGKGFGECQKLGVDVRGKWQACSLYMPLFN